MSGGYQGRGQIRAWKVCALIRAVRERFCVVKVRTPVCREESVSNRSTWAVKPIITPLLSLTQVPSSFREAAQGNIR